MSLIICAASGTVVGAESAYLVPDSSVTEGELDACSDSQIAAIGRERGHLLLADITALDLMAAILDKKGWSSETLDTLATLIRGTGRTVADNFYAPSPD